MEKATLINQPQDLGRGHFGLIAPLVGPIVEDEVGDVAGRLGARESKVFGLARYEDEPEVDHLLVVASLVVMPPSTTRGRFGHLERFPRSRDGFKLNKGYEKAKSA